MPPSPWNMTSRELLHRERMLQQHINGLYYQVNQCVNDLQHKCHVLETALERSKKEACDNLKAEKQNVGIAERRCISLHAENNTLWKFIEEIEIVSSNPDKTSPTFRDLYRINMELCKQVSDTQRSADDCTMFYDTENNKDGIEIMEAENQFIF
ncbi:hypothetical protein ACJ73_05704 [Blastomyces percursus]|uniref:Uncharacterized protein n=1 Tax=Blastomyces percursus TaxID=1658174 RepID=A0A1J9Q325_9EURO|nr:hypothetical protein ACJ73_05704 [Blastomyces percursus]